MKETGLTGKRRPTTIAATPDDGNSQRKRRRRADGDTKQHLKFVHAICGCDTLPAPCVKDKTVDVR